MVLAVLMIMFFDILGFTSSCWCEICLWFADRNVNGVRSEMIRYLIFEAVISNAAACTDTNILSSSLTLPHVDGLVQNRSNSVVNAMELLQSCTKSWMWLVVLIRNFITGLQIHTCLHKSGQSWGNGSGCLPRGDWISRMASYRRISQGIEGVRSVVRVFQ